MRSKSNSPRWAPGRALGLALVLVAAACSRERAGSESQAAAESESRCSPVAVHPRHATYACTTCHACNGIVSFDPAGAAVIPGGAPPSFDPATKTCSNVACHSVPPGSYRAVDYYPWDGYDWSYGGSVVTPSWTAAAGTNACAVCHGYPPTSSGGAWHSGWHAGVSVASARNPDLFGYNACSTCHPDVESTVTGTGTPDATIVTTITTPSLHRNGVIEVRYFDMARWNQGSCDLCHFGL